VNRRTRVDRGRARARETVRIDYRVQNVRFSIEAERGLVREIGAAVLPGARARAGGRDGTAFAVSGEGRGFWVARGSVRLWRVGSRAELLPWLEAEVVHWLLRRLARYVQLHAAVVERSGRALLVVGGPDAGKTSLACAMALAGWGVMSDEVALVEPRGTVVAAFPRALFVKSGTARRLKELRRVAPRRVALAGGLTPIRYVSPRSFGRPVRRAATIGWLAFPEWSRVSRVGPVGEREALERLLRSSLNTMRHPRASFETCVGLVRRVRLLRVGVADLRDAADRLAEAVEGSL